MQQEMMLRLLKDGKIIRYLKFDNTGHFSCDSICEPDGGMMWLRDNPIYINGIDSFEQGIKVGDEWFFTGDIIEFFHNDYSSTITDWVNVPQKKATGILNIDKYGWIIEQLTGDSNAFYDYDSPREWSWERLKVIGNIHQEATNEDTK